MDNVATLKNSGVQIKLCMSHISTYFEHELSQKQVCHHIQHSVG